MAKSTALMMKMNKKMLKFANKQTRAEETREKFARIQAKFAKRMSGSNANNMKFLNMMDKTHLFDGLNQLDGNQVAV